MAIALRNYSSAGDRARIKAPLAAVTLGSLLLSAATMGLAGAGVWLAVTVFSAHDERVDPLEAASLKTLPYAPGYIQLRMDRIAQAMGMESLPVILNTKSETGMGAHMNPAGNLVLGWRLPETLSYEELDFILAHEAAHAKFRDLQTRDVLVRNMFLAGAGYGAALLQTAATAPPLFLALSVAAPVAILGGIFLAKSFSRAAERRADRVALDVTGDFRAAVNALRKSGAFKKETDSLWDYLVHATHPERYDRFINLKKASVAARLPRLRAA